MVGKFDFARLDLVFEMLEYDEETGVANFKLVFDPDRYEWQDVDGKSYLYDKLDCILMTELVLDDLAKQLEGMPISGYFPKIEPIQEYSTLRLPHILASLDGTANVQLVESGIDEITSLSDQTSDFAILCLDIAGSTKLSLQLDESTYARIICSCLGEFASIISQHYGYVLKYTGDGIMAYFPAPSFISKNDLSLDCAMFIQAFVSLALNPALSQLALPQVAVRIGIDSGSATPQNVGHSNVKVQKDLLGPTVNLAAKIQQQAKPADILIGDTVYRCLHTSRKQMCIPVQLPAEWDYCDTDGHPYKLYSASVLHITATTNS